MTGPRSFARRCARRSRARRRATRRSAGPRRPPDAGSTSRAARPGPCPVPRRSGAHARDGSVRIDVGTAEGIARVSVLEGQKIAAGGSAWVQLRLATPLAVAVGDRFVVRRPSPSETLGGGSVADTSGERQRTRADAAAALERRSAPSPEDRLLASFEVARTPAEAGQRRRPGAGPPAPAHAAPPPAGP